jgi:hypothetical protein
MRTVLFIVAGFVLLAVCLGGAKVFASSIAEPMRTAVIAFCLIWFLVAAGNLWMGVATAGYSFMEELPIFLLIFGLPAAAAVSAKWKWL